MSFPFDFKVLFSLLSIAAVLAGYFPYLSGMFRGEVKPHAYTWLIWAMTQGTAAVGSWYGGGGWSVLSLSFGTVLILLLFVLSFKYGTRNITVSDTILLALCLIAMLVWWQLKNPVGSVFLVSAIDFAGYVPSYRKTWDSPWSESATTWGIFALSCFFSLLAVPHYNLITVPYLAVVGVANVLFVTLCLWRRVVARRLT
ncbi:MAG: hypothetical protein JO026_01975 [Patescibacteria group bacterium]|nr:hypothetical protein [Patescibacteria group bacterium]